MCSLLVAMALGRGLCLTVVGKAGRGELWRVPTPCIPENLQPLPRPRVTFARFRRVRYASDAGDA